MTEAGSFLRIASQWLIGTVLAVVLIALFAAVTAVQLTTDGTGQRILRRAVAVTTEIDHILPDIQDQLQEQAMASPEPEIMVPDFPIPIELSHTEALTLEGDDLRARILDDAARRLYDDGTSAWADADPDSDQDIERISTPGAIKESLGLITDRNHTLFLIATFVLAFLALPLAIMLLATIRSYVRLIALGAVTLGAALPSLGGAIAVRLAMRTAEEEGDSFVNGMFDLGVDAMWVPIRFYLALSALGFAVISIAVFLLWWQSRYDSPPGPPPAAEASV
jgi:hypothetical protein